MWGGALLQSAVSPWRIAAIAVFAIAFSFIRGKRRLAVITIALLIGATAMSMRQVSLESSAISNRYGSEVSFLAQVKTDPSKTASGNFSFTARLIQFSLTDSQYSLRVPVRILLKESVDLLPGQMISGTASVVRTEESRVAALLIVQGAFTQVTQPSSWAA